MPTLDSERRHPRLIDKPDLAFASGRCTPPPGRGTLPLLGRVLKIYRVEAAICLTLVIPSRLQSADGRVFEPQHLLAINVYLDTEEVDGSSPLRADSAYCGNARIISLPVRKVQARIWVCSSR
jgi:hypothetical protein